MTSYDLLLAWNWAYDIGFVGMMEAACRERGLSLLQVTPENLPETIEALHQDALTSRALFNRASDTDSRFSALVRWARERGWFRINPRELETWAADKATMHLEFISAGLHTPYSIILPPRSEQPQLPALNLSALGGAFAIKPANGGGGDGVVVPATCHEQVERARHEFPHDKYLVQAHVVPVRLDGRPAWFRVLWCAGKYYPFWWDPAHRVYEPLSAGDLDRPGLRTLPSMMTTIARVSRLHLFSTELALTADGVLLAVDYVNDQIDLRPQSQAGDGVPDSVLWEIAVRLADLISRQGPLL